MQRELALFESFADADRADTAYYASLTPQERVDLLMTLVAAHREAAGEAGRRFERVYRVTDFAGG